MICLCANCHGRADSEKWGPKALQQYKKTPWVMRQNNPPLQIDAVKRIVLIIDMEIVDFDGNQENILKHALAGFLSISPQVIHVRSKQKGSVKITLELPEPAAEELLRRFENNPAELRESLPAFWVVDIREPHPQERPREIVAEIMTMRQEIASVIERYRIPPEDAEDVLQEAQILAIPRWDKIKDPEAWFIATLRKRCVAYWRRRRDSLSSAVDAAILQLLSDPVTSPTEKSALQKELNGLLEELPPRCREIFRLRYNLGYGSEVVEQTEYRPVSLRKTTRRCMVALANVMVKRGFLLDEHR